MKKIVINKCWGGYGLSEKAVAELKRRGCKHLQEHNEEEFFKCEKEHGSWQKIWGNLTWAQYKETQRKWLGIAKIGGKLITDEHRYENRDCPFLIEVVKKLGKRANGRFANLKVIEIPANVKWEIDDYDGMESIEEKHRSWG